jgi:hypothetical protein
MGQRTINYLGTYQVHKARANCPINQLTNYPVNQLTN